jgi:hypothetical protein
MSLNMIENLLSSMEHLFLAPCAISLPSILDAIALMN